MDYDKEVASYSMPLIASDGTIYGIIGIEYMASHLSSLLPSDELEGLNKSAYALVKYQTNQNNMEVITTSGSKFNQWYGDSLTIKIDDLSNEKSNIYYDKGRFNEKLCLSVSPFKIYNSNTPFEDEIVALVGITTNDVLFASGNSARMYTLIIYLCILVISVVTVLIISRQLTKPIKKLASEVQERKNTDKVVLFHTKIEEIDQLVDAIEKQSETINKSLARTEFFSRMSHDLRTPMNAIIGFSSPEVISMCDNEELIHNLNRINSSSKYLLGLINEVLDMTKIESGKIDLETSELSFQQFWIDIYSMIKEVALQKDIIFIQNYPKENLYVLADQQRLSQIVVNLLANAIKFTNEGGKVELSVKYENHDNKNLSCEIEITDTGIGMSEEFQTKMFLPFVQEKTTKDGTGLGLAIVKQLVELIKGKINCKSVLGKGTTFTINLDFPLVEKESIKANIPDYYDETEFMKVFENKRILLCEDNKINIEIVLLLLRKFKFKVDVAQNGQIGIDLFSNSQIGYYDLILMDIRMPICDGLEATMKIRALDREDAKNIPIIAMTANVFDDDKKFSKEAGMNEHLSKPINTRQLYTILYYYIGNGK